MPEWSPMLLARRLTEVAEAGVLNAETGLGLIASAIEAKAKASLAQTSHTRDTPSPARKGGPPSLVTGTGRRSIGQDHRHGFDGLEILIGTQAGVYPPEGETPSSKYLWYQETLARFNHPFLRPAFDSVVRAEAMTRLLAAFKHWPKF